jgi:hypothetical protein
MSNEWYCSYRSGRDARNAAVSNISSAVRFATTGLIAADEGVLGKLHNALSERLGATPATGRRISITGLSPERRSTALMSR